MSHVVCSKIVISDLELLKKAVAALGGLTWNESKKNFNWYGEWVNDYSAKDAAYKNGIDVDQYGTCDVCLQMPGVNYEIGIVKRRDGTGWSLVWDNVSDGATLTRHIGRNGEKLMAEYAKAYIRDFAERNGFVMETSEDSEGNQVLTMVES
jgi:hypothetical protein